MADYGQDLTSACFRFPLCAALALVPPRAERLGHGNNSAGYADRASIAKRAEVKAWLRGHYRIVPSLPPLTSNL